MWVGIVPIEVWWGNSKAFDRVASTPFNAANRTFFFRPPARITTATTERIDPSSGAPVSGVLLSSLGTASFGNGQLLLDGTHQNPDLYYNQRQEPANNPPLAVWNGFRAGDRVRFVACELPAPAMYVPPPARSEYAFPAGDPQPTAAGDSAEWWWCGLYPTVNGVRCGMRPGTGVSPYRLRRGVSYAFVLSLFNGQREHSKPLEPAAPLIHLEIID